MKGTIQGNDPTVRSIELTVLTAFMFYRTRFLAARARLPDSPPPKSALRCSYCSRTRWYSTRVHGQHVERSFPGSWTHAFPRLAILYPLASFHGLRALLVMPVGLSITARSWRRLQARLSPRRAVKSRSSARPDEWRLRHGSSRKSTLY